MVSNRCKLKLKEELKNLGIAYESVDLGYAELREHITDEQRELLQKALRKSGLELMDDQFAILIEKIKNIIVDMVHHQEEAPKLNFSDYLETKLDYDYTYLSNLFSETTGTTIEHFIIAHKIERVKELLIYDELSLTEISFALHYSSVAHLSSQFKKVTGLTPTYYKALKKKKRKMLEKV
jgi:YesN/AraC family two-component response regulator